MNSADLSLYHLVRQPQRPSERPPLLILLHGVGSNERDLFGLAQVLDERLLIVSVRASNTLGPDSFAWFRVGFTPTGAVIDSAQAEASRQMLLRFIPEVTAVYGADPEQVYLMGFSQGAIMSASVALTEPELVAGAVLMSGRILSDIGPQIASPERLRGLPLLVLHGTADPMLPVQNGRASRAMLEKLPVALEYHEYPMAHEVSRASMDDVVAWLTQRLDEPTDQVKEN